MTLTAAMLPLPTGSAVTDAQAAAAQSIVEAYCGWPLELANHVETPSCDGGTLLVLPSLLVTAVASLTFLGNDPWGNPWPVLTENVDWYWQPNGIITRLGGGVWPAYGQVVQVSYTGGYNPLPGVVLAVCSSVAQRLAADTTAQSHLENVGGIQTNTTYSQAVTAGAGLTPVEQAALNRYKIETIA